MRSVCSVLVALVALLAGGTSASAQPPSSSGGFLADWFERSDAAKAEQPDWITPLVTVTPRLEQELRWDYVDQVRPDGTVVDSYGGGKGLELIPTDRIEIIVALPTYVDHVGAPALNGFADFHVLVKYRLLSRSRRQGDAIVTAFFDATVPTGSGGNGAAHPILTPTLAAGKGVGAFAVQSTFGVSLPTADTSLLGRSYQSNTALQYRGVPKLWPELELNATWFQEGRFSGEHVVYVTPGVVVGRIRLNDRLGLTFGAGVQIAVSRFRLTDHNLILSARMPF